MSATCFAIALGDIGPNGEHSRCRGTREPSDQFTTTFRFTQRRHPIAGLLPPIRGPN